ncbi:MAG: hypothetical protein KJ622_04615 [Alphaproteobacteria bacterium]|nr:hypothetical protein [Alphaproteobacteria bacterium]
MQLALSNIRRMGLAAAAIVLGSVSVLAAESPTIQSELFDRKHIDDLSAGTKLVYDFERSPSEPKLLGPGMKSVIEVNVDKLNDDGTRDLTVQIFRGEYEREPRNMGGLTINPVMVFYLDRAVSGFSLLAGGSQAYHKNRFRLALRTEGGLAPVKFAYNGKEVEGYRLAVRPFTGDRKNIDKMKGYENAQFDFLMSDDVPGYFAAFKSHYSSPKPGSPSLEETIVLQGVTIPEDGVGGVAPDRGEKQ